MAIAFAAALLTNAATHPVGQVAAAEPVAKELFGAVQTPSVGASLAIGSYARGCLSGGVELPAQGRGWQVMRPSRNRAWGHPDLVAWIERFAAAAPGLGWPGLLVGDLAQPRGGPMTSGHTSHQVGLDVDVWLQPMPPRPLSRGEREAMSAQSVLQVGTRQLRPPGLDPSLLPLLRYAARTPEVERIFVHPAIKRALCDGAGPDRAWLGKIRPWYGHDDHFHVRLACPAGESECREQAEPPQGDGCGADLAWWLGDEPWIPKTPPVRPPPPIRLGDLPATCRAVLSVAGRPD